MGIAGAWWRELSLERMGTSIPKGLCSTDRGWQTQEAYPGVAVPHNTESCKDSEERQSHI